MQETERVHQFVDGRSNLGGTSRSLQVDGLSLPDLPHTAPATRVRVFNRDVVALVGPLDKPDASVSVVFIHRPSDQAFIAVTCRWSEILFFHDFKKFWAVLTDA